MGDWAVRGGSLQEQVPVCNWYVRGHKSVWAPGGWRVSAALTGVMDGERARDGRCVNNAPLRWDEEMGGGVLSLLNAPSVIEEELADPAFVLPLQFEYAERMLTKGRRRRGCDVSPCPCFLYAAKGLSPSVLPVSANGSVYFIACHQPPINNTVCDRTFGVHKMPLVNGEED